MFTQNEDEDLFPTNVNSNLTNLFGGVSINAQTDLKYTAPRQPKPTDLNPKETSDNANTATIMDVTKVSVICAKVVLANKLVNDEVVNIGKVGFAILGTTESAKEFLLYRDRQNVLSKASNNNQFTLINHENDGLKFVDDSNTTWSVRFLNHAEYGEFINVVNSCNVKLLKPEIKLKIEKVEVLKNDLEDNVQDSQIRADILSRMAKMGQSVLPGPKFSTNEDKINESHSQISSEVNNEIIDEIKSKHIENKNISKDSLPSSSITYQNQYLKPQILNPQTLNPSQIQPYLPLQTYHQIQPNLEFNLFVSENRTQNSEIRINLTSISSKLDTVLHEVSKLKISPTTDRLENEFLKSKLVDMEEKLKKYDDLKTKMDKIDYEGLINKNAKQLDRIQELEESKRGLEEELKRLKSKSDRVEELERKEALLLKENDELKFKLTEKNAKIAVENEKVYKKILEENELLKKSKEKLESGNFVKDIMNEMFQNVLGEFEEDEERISFKQLKYSVSKHLKQTTFKIIDSLK